MVTAAYLGVLDDEMSWREDEGDKRRREKHFNDGDAAVIAAEDLGERVGVIDAETLRGSWQKRQVSDTRPVQDAGGGEQDRLLTDSETAVVLVEGYKV